MKTIIENKKTNVRGFIVSEGERVVVNLDGVEKDYSILSFKRLFRKVKDEVAVTNEEPKVEQLLLLDYKKEIEVEENEVEENEVVKVVENQVVNLIKEEKEDVTIEETIEQQETLQDKVIALIKEFVENPNFNTNETKMEYVERATINKVTLNKRNLIEFEVQKKAVGIFFNQSTLSQDSINRMTKLIPESYGWTSNALLKIVSETQLDFLQQLLVETREGKLALDKKKAEEKRAKQERLEKERLAKKEEKERERQAKREAKEKEKQAKKEAKEREKQAKKVEEKETV